MQYVKLVISLGDDYQESLIVELMELDFDAFEQQEDEIITYIPKERFSDVYRERIEGLLQTYPGHGRIKTEEVVADQNWNEEWERTLQPIRVGRFYVSPTWSGEPPPPGSIVLEIDPKMAFGTGYHETTRLMLRFLPEVINKGDKVLDAGTGTGILAIASVKLGAEEAFAFDIDEWSITNSRENIYINEVEKRVDVQKGSVELIQDGEQYDAVLANIERNTILDMLPDLHHSLKEGGHMLLSGLLENDEHKVMSRAGELALVFEGKKQENEWIALHFRK